MTFYLPIRGFEIVALLTIVGLFSLIGGEDGAWLASAGAGPDVHIIQVGH